MKQKIFRLMLMVLVLSPMVAGAVTTEDFEAKTTGNFLNLCTATPDDPYYTAAINFCHGFLVGAFRYHVAQYTGPDSKPMICFPDPAPSRNQAIQMFIEWATAHPEFMSEKPVETEFRFLLETWPCQ